MDYTSPLIPDCTYHIYNRAINKDQLFLTSENYFFFLKRYKHYISPIADTFCYCLMPNHFHLLVRFKNENEINATYRDKLSVYYSLQFSHFFNSYSKAFNIYGKRRGSLFMRQFKRKRIKDESHLINVVRYIHLNPVEAGLCRYPGEWRHSSFNSILSKGETILKRKELLDWFDGIKNFKFIHQVSG